jgi:hypothetical protein
MRLVPLGINLDGYTPRPPRRQEPFTIGFFARIAPEKGLHVLADEWLQRILPCVRHRFRDRKQRESSTSAGWSLDHNRRRLVCKVKVRSHARGLRWRLSSAA